MADLERVYNVPLRKGYMKAPKYMRANKAVKVLRDFLKRHMKSENIKIGPFLNSEILKHGRKNVVHHVSVKAIKDKDNVVKAELASAKDLGFLKPKVQEEEKVKIKIPGLGKKEAVEKKEEIKKTEEKEKLEEEKIKIETDKKEVEKLKEVVTKGKLKEKIPKEKEALKSPRKSLEAETYGRSSKKIQHKKSKK